MENKETNENGIVEKKKGGWVGWFIFIIIIAVIAFLATNAENIYLAVRSGSSSSPKSEQTNTAVNTPQLLTRNANNGDIEKRVKEELTFKFIYEVTPNIDIADLQVTIKFSDENRDIVYTAVKNVGNVKEGTTYSVTVDFGDVGWLTVWSIAYGQLSVTGGKVSYFGYKCQEKMRKFFQKN